MTPSVVATFMRQDLRLLEEEFDVSLYPCVGVRCISALRPRVAAADVVINWFAGRHALASVWLACTNAKPVITIIGGFESAWIPSISYGIRPGSIRHAALKWILKHSRLVLTVSSVAHDGIIRQVPEIGHKTRLIYNAVDTDSFNPGAPPERHGVICVGRIEPATFELKGWRTFVELARRMPDVRFIAVGPADDSARRKWVNQSPPNLTWLGERSPVELVQLYQLASVYVQASMHESFCLALAEAMACGCVPVTTRGGALPEVAGDAGFFIDRDDLAGAEAVLRSALAGAEERRDGARRQIVVNYPLLRRGEALRTAIRDVLAGLF